MKSKSLPLPRQLIPKVAELGFHELYVVNNKIFGRVYIDQQCYHILQDRVQHFINTGELNLSSSYYSSKIKSAGINVDGY